MLTLENDENVYYKGGDDDNPVRFAISNLGFTNRTGPLYLNVAVYPTNYENSAHQWASVKLNGNMINEYCTPDQSCGDKFFSCVSWMEISRNISSESGGSIVVDVSSSGVKSGPCDYPLRSQNGILSEEFIVNAVSRYPLYARVFITETPPEEPKDSLTIWVIIGTIIFVVLVLLFAIWYYVTMGKKRDEKYEPEAQTGLPVEHDPEANRQMVTTKPSASPRRSPRLNNAKVAPSEENPDDFGPMAGNSQLDDEDVEAAHNVVKNKSLLAHYELDE